MNLMPINRLKAVIAVRINTNKWLDKMLNKNETTISPWYMKGNQPFINTFILMAKALCIDVRKLINSIK